MLHNMTKAVFTGLSMKGISHTMFKQFYPDKIEESTYKIDFKELYANGIRGLIFDIDNTLVEHGYDADAKAVMLFRELKETGFSICLLSNNKKERVERFNKEVNVGYIYNAHKPSGRNYWKAMDMMHTTLANTIFIGDQLFTDVYGAKRIGMKHILVKPISPHEEIQIILKRYLEKIVLFFYRRSLRKEAKHQRRNS